MFERIISIDWSGASLESKGVDLRVAMFDAATNKSQIINRRQGKKEYKSWSRSACRNWLRDRLKESPPTLIACDFGFGFPYGTDQQVFGVQGWNKLVTEISQLYSVAGKARATAQAINASEKFQGHGPYRFNESRTDFRFYLDHGISYYRLTEMLAPQAISQWYLGSGGTVGFHSITGLAALAEFMELRAAGELDFEVWPQETRVPLGDKHVFAECYPSICPALDDYGECQDAHQRDAWKVLKRLVNARSANQLSRLFEIAEQPCGRIAGVSFEEQIEFEGFILGLR